MLHINLTRKQQEVFDYLLASYQQSQFAPTLNELCDALGLKSRGSLHKHIKGLIEADLVVNPEGKQRGIRLSEKAIQLMQQQASELVQIPFAGVIAAGMPIEAVEDVRYMSVPEQLKTEKPCYILQVKGDSMIEAGIFDGDWVIIEKRDYARDGEIVVALVNQIEATLKYIEQTPDRTLLIPANSSIPVMQYAPSDVQIQGVLVGQMRSYVH